MIYDIHTKNISFLKISKMLRDKKVKNNKFMLTLYDPDLVGVDPFSHEVENNSELQFKIYRECCRNLWYYIREVVRIPADGANIYYELNLGNCTLNYLRTKNKNIILILPRQHYKSVSECIFETWNLCFVTKNSNVIYLNKAKPDAIKNLKVFRDVIDCLPNWMLDNFLLDRKNDIDNQEQKVMFKRNNTLKAISGGSDPDAADKAGRGLTVANLICDEFAFLKYNDLIYKACQPAFKRASENAKKHNAPYGMVLLTTPNNKDNPAGAFCYSMINKAAKWNVECFDLSDEELDHFVEMNSENNFIFVQYTYKELGRDEEWLKQQIREMNGDLATVKREILLEWPLSTESSVFSEDDLEKVHQFIRDVQTRIFAMNRTYCIDFYEQPDLNRNYIISCDVAGGLEHDNSALSIIDPEDFRIVGDFRNNRIDTDNYKKLIIELMTFYFQNALLVIERNSYGLNILQSLMKDSRIEPRMYREMKEAKGEKTTKDGFTVKKKTNVIAYGVDTNATTRKQMFDLLPEIVETEYDKFISPNIYSDLSGLEKKKNGKIEHSAGGHDDNLMSYLIFRYAVFYGKCFKDKFGIYPTPSRANVRVVSSQENFSKIASIIENANKVDTVSTLSQNPVYAQLYEQQQKLKEGDEHQQLDSFLRIANLNNN